VEIVKNEKDQYLKISVEDSGIGIKQKDQCKLFKLFGFLDNHQGMNTNGIGLGLVIANKIVKQFNGKMSFSSKENKGSIFTFTIKLENIENGIQKNVEKNEDIFELNSKNF
tara:strand:- start:91 stop:423 length:333 start_codon:yes stop_codon:yes gene_type:complete